VVVHLFIKVQVVGSNLDEAEVIAYVGPFHLVFDLAQGVGEDIFVLGVEDEVGCVLEYDHVFEGECILPHLVCFVDLD